MLTSMAQSTGADFDTERAHAVGSLRRALLTVVTFQWQADPDHAFSDRHRIWLAGGALVAHTLFVVLAAILHVEDALSTILAVTTGPATIAVTIYLLARLAKRVGAGSFDDAPTTRMPLVPRAADHRR